VKVVANIAKEAAKRHKAQLEAAKQQQQAMQVQSDDADKSADGSGRRKKKERLKPLPVTGVAINCAYTQLVALSTLKPNPKNPNKHPKKQVGLLADIIKAHGWRRPITVSTRSGYIVKGHCAYLSAKLLGLTDVPVDYQGYESAKAEYADLLADNKIAEMSSTDDEMVMGILEEIRAGEYDLKLTGYGDDEFKKMVESAMKTEEPEVEFAQELLLEHNYIVLYFDNPLDFQVAQEKFGLQKVRDLVPRKNQPIGTGRVLEGKKWLARIK
jgi:hypothetical protein